MADNGLKQHLINHVSFVLDASGSMAGLRRKVIDVFNRQVQNLVEQSKRWNQETRVTVYVFGDRVKCVAYGIDVMRLPKIDTVYHDGGMTALIDATMQSQIELAETAQRYGDHAFLTFVLTDGGENASTKFTDVDLKQAIGRQGDNWTVACLVPDVLCKNHAIRFGFPTGNVMIWDTTEQGLEKAAETVTQVTDSFYAARSTGTRGSTTLFASNVTQAQVDASGMKPISPSEFIIVPVALASTSTLAYVIPKKSVTKRNPQGVKHVEIMPFVQETGRTYVAGTAFYKLTKSEKYDFQKDIVLVHRITKKVYRGDACKALIGLTGASTRIKPQPIKGGDYDIYVQSTSVNRHLEVGGQVLLFHK